MSDQQLDEILTNFASECVQEVYDKHGMDKHDVSKSLPPRLTYKAAKQQLKQLLADETRAALSDPERLIRDLTDDDRCNFDHNGNCQTHYYFAYNNTCVHADAKLWLALQQPTKSEV